MRKYFIVKIETERKLAPGNFDEDSDMMSAESANDIIDAVNLWHRHYLKCCLIRPATWREIWSHLVAGKKVIKLAKA